MPKYEITTDQGTFEIETDSEVTNFDDLDLSGLEASGYSNSRPVTDLNSAEGIDPESPFHPDFGKKDRSFWNEAYSAGNRLVEGTAGLVDFVSDAARNLSPTQPGGPRLFGLNENILNMPASQAEGLGNLIKEGAEKVGFYGKEAANTAPGKIAGEVMAYVPSVALGGGILPAVSGGLAAGTAKAAGAGELGQAIAGGVGSLAPAAAQALTNALKNPAMALRRKALGAQRSDYGKASDMRLVDFEDEGLQTLARTKIDEVITSGELGKSRDPAKMLEAAKTKSRELGGAVQAAIKNFDEANAAANKAGEGATIYVDFKNAKKMIDEGDVLGPEAEKFADRLNAFQDAFAKKGKNSLSYLQNQKKALGEIWDPANKAESNFARAMYSDVKAAIEKYVPEVAGLNKELSKWQVVTPILGRGLKAQEARSFLDTTKSLGWTTGGIMAPAIAGSSLGPLGTAAGLGVGAALKGITTPRGQEATGKALTALASLMSRQNTSVLPSLLTAGSPIINKKTTDLYEGLFSKKENASADAEKPKQKIASMDIPKDSNPLVKAVVWQESRGKPSAVSPKGATGLMQLMPATAKEIAAELGVKDYDLKDPETNLAFGQHYLDKMLKQFDGDEKLALAAYNAGPGRVRSWINKWGADWDTISAKLKEQGIYKETRNYVPSVLKRKMEIVEV